MNSADTIKLGLEKLIVCYLVVISEHPLQF